MLEEEAAGGEVTVDVDDAEGGFAAREREREARRGRGLVGMARTAAAAAAEEDLIGGDAAME